MKNALLKEVPLSVWGGLLKWGSPISKILPVYKVVHKCPKASKNAKKSGMYPCSTKRREVLGNPSPTPKRFPETRDISRGRSPREISRVEGNLEGGGDGFPNTSRVLVEYGHSPHHQFIYRDGSGNPSLWAGKD